MDLSELLTVKQFCKKYPAFTEGGMRSLIFYRMENGFDGCIVHIGRRVLINTQAFVMWVDKQNNNKLGSL